MAMSPKQKAFNTVKYLKLTNGEIRDLRHERTLNVELEGTQLYWPAELVAQYCLRVALENGCTKVRVHQGIRRAEFDVMQLVTFTRHLTIGGTLPTSRMKFVPAKAVTRRRFAHFGEVVEPRRGWVSVPSQPPVSSPTLAG